MKIGQIARTCSVFGVDFIVVFRDPRGRGESSLIRRVLEYLETPQYLRRRLFPLDATLKFAGLLPPLRIPSHKPKVPLERLRTGEFREGVVLADGGSVDVGLDSPVSIRQGVGEGKRVTIRITSTSPLQGLLVEREDVKEYWGYRVEVASVEHLLTDSRFGVRVATSRMGDPLESRLASLVEESRKTRGLMLLFGAPSRGLFDMVKDLRTKADFVLNLYPEQNTVTIRTEEAIASGLYLAQLLSVLGNTKA